MSTINIVTFGGGSGAPLVLQALLKAGFSQIDAICAATDSGGKTGFIRSDERDRVIAISDLLRNLLALISDEENHLGQIKAFIELISYTDGRNRNLGYTNYYALFEKYGYNYLQVQRFFERLLGIRFAGRAIPVTLQPTTLCFQTKTGAIHRGEHELDLYSMSKDRVKHVWLDPQVVATPDAVEAVRQATHIIYCPGSVYGSIIANLLPQDIRGTLSRSKAVKIVLSNLVSTRNETHKFKPVDYWKLFQKYTQTDQPFDIFVAPNFTREQFEQKYPDVADHYAKEHSYFLGWGKRDYEPLEWHGVQVCRVKHYARTRKLNRLRHDPQKLARLFAEIIVS